MIPSLAEVRARGISLPTDDDAAQGIIDEQAAWLTRKVGPLWGSRSETFYVGLSATHGKLGLARYTDEVTLTDAGSAVDTAHYRLIDNGTAIQRVYTAPTQWWTGPYVTATYVPNDEDEVRRVLFGLIALAGSADGPYNSESIGSYSYTKSLPGGVTTEVKRAALAASLIPKRDQLVTLYAVSRLASYGDPVINRAEPAWD